MESSVTINNCHIHCSLLCFSFQIKLQFLRWRWWMWLKLKCRCHNVHIFQTKWFGNFSLIHRSIPFHSIPFTIICIVVNIFVNCFFLLSRSGLETQDKIEFEMYFLFFCFCFCSSTLEFNSYAENRATPHEIFLCSSLIVHFTQFACKFDLCCLFYVLSIIVVKRCCE